MSRPVRLPPPWRAALAALAFVFAGSASAALIDDPGTPGRAYLDLRAAAERATTADAVLPLLSANYRRVLTNLPKTERDAWLARFKRIPPGPAKLQAQAQSGDRCTLGVIARDPTHVKWSGRIEMVREGGAWKLADESWTTETR